ncbi:MAG: PQQ-binding-like beta-propeller repeat protein [Kiritimatiellales bacterium]|nr:PQQ-binding-like beta-propeller repeat protein [Kiritimatiellales bacterium]
MKLKGVAVVCYVVLAMMAKAGPLELVKQSGLKGGLVVHVGCGDGAVAASLRINDNVLVQGLDQDVEAARKLLLKKKLHGPVSVAQWGGGALPYNDNLVNLLFVEEDSNVSKEEMLRVLAPGGTVYVEQGGDWKKTAKPIPADQDNWTHSLYDAAGNAVSQDTRVGPPRHLQWFGGPRFGRQHEHMSSFTSMVSDGGKIFYIIDKGSPVSILLPSEWYLIAKDAYNGALLWEREIPEWHSRLWPMKNGPVVLPRRLVAMDGKVYVTLGLDAPVVELDAETGKTLKTCEGTEGTYEFVVSEGVVFSVVSSTGKFFRHQREELDMVKERNMIYQRTYPRDSRFVTASDAATGKVLWQVESKVSESSLCADGRHVVFNDYDGLVCLDRKTGKQYWKTSVEQSEQYRFGRASTVVLTGDKILFSGMTGTVTAYAAADGKKLWSAAQPATGHDSPSDIFVMQGRMWYGQTASGKQPGTFYGINLETGAVEESFSMDKKPSWFHHRCHRGRATEKYILASRTGIEFVEVGAKTYDVNHWVRGACTYGVMPANGILYAPQHPCACYLSTKLSYFNALVSPAQVTYEEALRSAGQRLVRGSAYGRFIDVKPGPGDWPVYRHDNFRSGAATTTVGGDLKQQWKAGIGGELTACIAAAGKVFVARKDEYALYALDAQNGKTLWRYAVDAGIDSPPSYVNGLLVLGSADGSVYCLTADKGELVWRFDAAPQRRQMVALDRLESPWPVHGSVLVRGNTAYCLSGRSRFLDGGMRLVLLDVKTGAVKAEKVLDNKDMESGEDLHSFVKGLSMPVGLSDVLSANDDYMFLHSQVMDFDGNTLSADSLKGQEDKIRHLFTPTGFLDGSWFHRSYWLYGTTFNSGWKNWYDAGRANPAGRLLVKNGESIFGFGRVQTDYRWMTPLAYHLYHIDESAPLLDPDKKVKKNAGYGFPTEKLFKYHWSQDVPLFATGLTVAGDVLFAAGAPKLVDEKKDWENIYETDVEARLQKQTELLDGSEGAVLMAVNTKTGKKLADLKLPAIPVWDGMIAANGKVYVCLKNGDLICLGN